MKNMIKKSSRFLNPKMLNPSSQFFEILSELGIIGLLIFILVFLIILFKFIKLSFKESNYFLYGNSLLILVYFVPFLIKFLQIGMQLFFGQFLIGYAHIKHKEKFK